MSDAHFLVSEKTNASSAGVFSLTWDASVSDPVLFQTNPKA